MNLSVKFTMLEKMQEVAQMLPDGRIKEAISCAIASKAESFAIIENVFKKICSERYDDETMSVFLNAWKATHLKMLPIYGLSCRLNILGFESSDDNNKLAYLEASAFNASTSHEDLGIGFDAISHGRLYDEFAYSLVKTDEWKLSKFDVQKANDFSQWIYKSMLLKPIPYALCINMISEFYNHAEYAFANETFKYSMSSFYDINGVELENAIRYIDVHNQYETEIHHFMAVLHAIDKYEKASKENVDDEIIKEVITTYVDAITIAFESISEHFN